MRVESYELRVAVKRFQVSGFRCQVSGVRCQVSGVRCQVSGFRCQVSGVSGASDRGAASLIDKRNSKKRISNIEYRMSKEGILSIIKD